MDDIDKTFLNGKIGNQNWEGKMKKTVLLGAAALLLSGCATPQKPSPPPPTSPKTLTMGEIREIMSGVRAALKDPDSAKFGTMKASVGPVGLIYVCGWVNAKNSFGGYTGFQPYLGTLVHEGLLLNFKAISIGGDDIETAVTINQCGKYGLAGF